MSVKQYFLNRAASAQKATESDVFCAGARKRYARIALRYRLKAARVITV